MTATEASSYCSSVMAGFVDIIAPNTTEANRDVQNYMQKVHLEAAWIGIYARKHDPQWIRANES